MGTVHGAARIAQRDLERVIAAFERARTEASFAPLSELLDDSELAGERFVEVRKYWLFGPKETRWPGALRCLERALEPLWSDEIELDKSLAELFDALHERGENADLELLASLMEEGRGLPDWMRDEGAPALLRPADLEALCALLDRFDAGAGPGPTEYLAGYVRALREAAARVGPDELLLLLS